LEKQRRPVENRSDVSFCHGSERLIDLLFGADTHNEQRLSNDLRCLLHFLDLKRRRGGIRVTTKAIVPGLGNISRRSPKRFGPSSVVNRLTPVALPPGRLKLATRPRWTGSTW
jgi:hypothetical protein